MNEITTIADQNPLSIIAVAVEKGFDADQLGKLVALHERIEAMNAKRAYDAAMNACQAEMPLIVRDGYNKETQKKFASAEWTQHLCKPIYSRHGFSLSFSTEPSQRDGFYNIYCDVKHVAGHQEKYSLAGVPNDSTGPKGGATKSQIQGMMSSMTYSIGRLTRMIFAISTSDEDHDGADIDPTLNQGQIDVLEKLLLDTEADKGKFLAWAAVERIADIPQKKFVNARDLLQAKLAKQKAVTA